MLKCSHLCCQFQDFLNNKYDQTYYFYEDDNCDTYCIFHAPKKIKEKFRLSQLDYFKQLIFEYITYIEFKTDSKYINFSKVVFINSDFYLDKKEGLNLSEYEIDFSEAIFLKNIRFDNLKCKKLIFKDSVFLDGGGIKNREEDKNLQIEELVFKPYRVDSDFVIDIGKYINRDTSLLEMKQGIIKKIQFENHKIGEGYLFFIGINEHTEEAHFENMLLDKVYFQNCDLSSCYFLNAKVEETEFRNCEFLKNDNLLEMNKIRMRDAKLEFLIFPIFIIIAIFLISIFNQPTLESSFLNIMQLFYYLIMIPYIVLALGSMNIWIELISWYVSLLFNRKIKKEYNTKLFNQHFAVADEQKIYQKLRNLNNENEQKNLQLSLDSLSNIYSQLKNNFKERDFQLSGDFFYSQRYTELISSNKKPLSERIVLSIHHFTNGFGERFMKPLLWFFMTLFIFAFIFTFILKANNDFISTAQTPLFLIKDANISLGRNNQSINIDQKMYMLYIKNNNEKNISKCLYGYNNKGVYNFNTQYILSLKNFDIKVGLLKSLSNMVYPFPLDTKKWFLDISKDAFLSSMIEMILLWYFAGAFILALWHRIKR